MLFFNLKWNLWGFIIVIDQDYILNNQKCLKSNRAYVFGKCKATVFNFVSCQIIIDKNQRYLNIFYW